jgi:hypothetical protein
MEGGFKMFKKLGITTLALAAALAVAAPTVTLARDRDDHHFRGEERHEVRRDVRHDRDDRYDRFRSSGTRFNFGVGVYAAPRAYAPAPAATGYYDQFGNWHAYGFYDQWGNWHPNAY